jgi:class 3 adenylate cyclase
MDRRLAAVMFADVVGYARLVGEDEPGTLSALKAQLREVVEPKVLEHKGRIVRFIGDGILVEFPSVVEATASAFELQTALAQRNATLPPSRRLLYRIGINLGDIIIDGSDLYGDGVNVAARLEAIAEPGGIAISASVYEQVKGKLPLAWQSMGAMRFKNVRERVGVYRLAGGAVQPPLLEPWMRRRRVWVAASVVAAGISGLAFLLLGPLAGDSHPLSEAMPAAEFRELLPGSEWGRYRQDGRDWVYFEYYTTHNPAKDSGEAYSYYGPCAFVDSRNCLPDVASLAALALFGETHQWRAERFNWALYEDDNIALHCILPGTEDEECFSYIRSEDEARDAEGYRGRFLRYKVNRKNLAEHVYDGESMFYEADKWDVQDLVSGLVPEE